MEELKLIVDMIAGLPQMALWVLAGFWAYKVIVIGSVYGVIRLGINKAYDWLTSPRKYEFDGIVTSQSVKQALIAQMHRVQSLNQRAYFDHEHIEIMREAIDDWITKYQERKNVPTDK